MSKVMLLGMVLLTMAVGYWIILGLVHLYYKVAREEDEDLQYRKEITREMEETARELREETERFNNTVKKETKV